MILIWFVLCLLLGWAGSKRNIGFFGGFVLSLLLSPIIGCLFVFTSERLVKD